MTLETAIRRASRGDGFTFGALSGAFEEMARELLAREWAHGDLKPENIIVRPDGTLRLIDYDAMFIPELAGRQTLEVGTPPYQHPGRDQTLFDKSVDDYSVAIIAASLRALALDPDLYKKHNRSDNIILYPADILSGRSDAYADVLQLFANHGRHGSYSLALSLDTPSPHIPNLAQMLQDGIVYTPAERYVPKVADVTSEYIAADPEPYQSSGLWGYRDGSGREVIPAVYGVAHAFSDGLAAVRIHGLWQVIDRMGAVVLDCPEYSVVKPFCGGLAAVCDDGGLWGYITRDGRVAVEPRYEMAGFFREGLAVVRSGGRYGYIDSGGRMVTEPVYDYATGFRDGRATVQLDGETFEIGPGGEKL